MRYAILLLCVPVSAALLSAQEPTKTENAAIERTKRLLASSLDPELPKISLEFFLNSEAKGAAIEWRANDCSQEPKNAGTEPSCVQADFTVKNRGAVTVLVFIGTFTQAPSKGPKVLSVTITDLTGKTRPVPRLSLLPMELHRPPIRKRMPKDLPVPVGAES